MTRVLIADDDKELLDLLCLHCRRIGLEVDSATTAMTALGKIEEDEPDLAILDIEMPFGNGLSVCEMMSSHEQLQQIPVIIMTGLQDEETIRRCHRLSAYYVLKSPDIWPRLEPLLRELLPPEELLPPDEVSPSELAPTDDIVEASQRGVPAGPRRSIASKSVVDVVFTMVGWDGGYLSGNEQDQPAGESVEGPWVLCIDDDSELTFSLKMRLEQRGIRVLRAFAGMEGYRYACMSPAKAILLDYEMPDGNGDYVLRRLKESPLTADIPVIVLTGRNDRSIQRTMLNLGAAEFLTKPCDWDRLWKTLAEHLEPVAEVQG